ncbi:MAG: S8 family peptidase [Bacteroidota bacterium]
MKKIRLLPILYLIAFQLLCISFPIKAQESENELDTMMRWQHVGPYYGEGWGVSSDHFHKEIMPGKKTKTVVVAVIDGGIDTSHPDLRSNLWVNADEIPSNGKDDDQNGYIDDIYGWNFIGGPNGDIGPENTEAVRIYNKYKDRFAKLDKKDVKKADRADFELYNKAAEKIMGELFVAGSSLPTYEKLKGHLDKILSIMGDDEFTGEDLRTITDPDEEFISTAAEIAYYMELGTSFESIYEDILEGVKYFTVAMNHHYNPDFDARHLVGDDPEDLTNRFYGNNNVTGPDAEHGTHVAGIIGAIRNNDLGIDGIASDVRIMALRAVPDGDERDKDVANAIRYAVDNGAKIINMSFGKGFSPQQQYVDDAIKYATSKGVLMVHAAGNDALSTDKNWNFPNANNLNKNTFIPWIEVGATDILGQMAEFSNYGSKSVDILAPGVNIYSTMPGGTYDYESGTSMAAPVVSGVAALLWSVYPELTVQELHSALMTGAVKPTSNSKTTQPGTSKQVPYKKMCKTGGVVNAYHSALIIEKKGLK